jgi:hypothetical protein
MRVFAKALLSVAVVCCAASLALAQRQPGGGRGNMGAMMEGPMLLLNKSVQDELKLTDDQKADIEKINKKMTEARTKAVADAGMDRAKIAEAMKPITEETTKSLKDGPMAALKPEQSKRFKQIEIQQKGLAAFNDEEVQKTLKITDKQKEEITGQIKDVEKDTGEIRKDAQGDQTKMREARTKITELNTKATDKIISSLTDDQKKAYKELVGEKFEIKFDFGGGKGKKGDKSF